MKTSLYQEIHAFEDVHWWFVSRRLILRRILDRFYLRPEAAKVLELGCGSGGNLKMLQKYGSLQAMELDDQARAWANARKLCQVEKGKLPHEMPFNDKFDLICMLDLLEHIDDELATLRVVRERLKENGLLVITVPAFQFLWSRHDEVNLHIRRYHQKRLLEKCRQAGLRVEYSTYFNTFLFPLVAAVRLLNNLLGREAGSDIKLPPTAANKFLTWLFSSERFFLPRFSFPCGVSILLVAGRDEIPPSRRRQRHRSHRFWGKLRFFCRR